MFFTIGNRVNSVVKDLNNVHQEITTVWESLSSLASATKSKIVEVESRIKDLEQNQKLFFWKETIEDRVFNGKEYCDLPAIQKAVCLASEFYAITEGKWNGYHDLVFLRSVMREIGIDTKKGTIKAYDFYKEFLNNSALQAKLIDDNALNERVFESPVHSPILSGIHKLNHLNGQENYIVETVANQFSKASIKSDKETIQLDLLSNYLDQLCNFNVQSEIKTFDFMIELLSGMEVLGMDNLEKVLPKSKIEQKNASIEGRSMPERLRRTYNYKRGSSGQVNNPI